ncbi:MAG: M13 family metallopeptidase [Gammaproteobacteria bacterium]|nr:M13 family metallopeptidase [Gammaproteobacteria bacterium]
MTRLVPMLLAAVCAGALAACSPQHSDTSTAPASAAGVVKTPAAAPASAPNPGINLHWIDRSIDPGDNFYLYANGDWLKEAVIPADRSSISTFRTVHKRTQKRITDIIRHAADSDPAPGTRARKIADFYTAYMNTEAIEKHGLKPLEPKFDAIRAIDSRSELARVLGNRLRQDVDPVNYTDFHTNHLFGLFVAQGLTDPSHNIAYLLQGGLTMPGRDYYLADNGTMAGYRDKFRAYIANMLEAAGVENAGKAADRVFDLEMKIAKAQASLVESQNIHQASNLWTLEEFSKRAPGTDWQAYFKAAGLADQKIIDAWQPEAITRLSKLVAEAPLKSWKALLIFHTLDRYAPVLPKEFARLSFEFHQRTLSGVPEQRERSKRAVEATSHALGFAVGKLYVDQYFSPEAKHKVEDLVHNLIVAFDGRLDALEWMTPATRKMARAKLEALEVAVGYPEHWPSYEGLEISADDPVTNAINVARFHYRQRLAMLGKPVNPDHWWMTPQLVNAINLPLENELQFPAGILQPPFFNPHADAAANYGSIGAVIGHEISHAFDNLGSNFDAEGRLHNWWSPQDRKHFEAATHELVEQYSRYEPLPGLHINGRQTLGENIADVSGLTIAYIAYHNSLEGKPAPVIAGLTGDQRFFIAFAQTWRSKSRDAALRQQIETNVHAPAPFRALTVRNLDAWYEAFDVQPDDKLYLKPNQRVKIW